MPDTAPNAAANDAFHQAVLRELIVLGADLARRVHAAAAPEPGAAEPAAAEPAAAEPAAAPLSLEAATIAFDRIARTVRRTVALANHLESAKAHAAADPARRAAARAHIIRNVEDAIHRRRNERELDVNELYAEFTERLEDPALDLDIENRPIDDIVEELCRDLGVAVQARSWVWKRRTPADIATLRARAATPTSLPIPGHIIPFSPSRGKGSG